MPIDGNAAEAGINEGARQLDLQARRYERYQRQAALLLRISLATIGVIAAFGGTDLLSKLGEIIDSSINLASTYQMLQSSDSGSLASQSPTVTIFFLVMWAILATTVFAISLILIAVFSFRVVFPDEHEPLIGEAWIERYQRENGGTQLIQDYRSLLRQNEEKLCACRKQLRHSFVAIFTASIAALLAIPPFYALSSDNPSIIQTFSLVGAFLILGSSSYAVSAARDKGILWFKTGYFHREVEITILLAVILSGIMFYIPAPPPTLFGEIVMVIVVLLPFFIPVILIDWAGPYTASLAYKFLAYGLGIMGVLVIINMIPPEGIFQVVQGEWILIAFLTSYYGVLIFVEVQLITLLVDVYNDRENIYNWVVKRSPDSISTRLNDYK